jgi:hypothetical protein
MKIIYLHLLKTISTSAQKLVVTRKRGVGTKSPENEPRQQAIDTELADVSSEGNGEEKSAGRRQLDTAISDGLNTKSKHDRRVLHSDRRVNTDHHYNGPSRRYTIDRRLNLKDRRANH